MSLLNVTARPTSERYAWYAVGVLIIAYTTGFLDRQILSLLVEPIRHDLGVNDVQIGLLQGLAFAIFYSICILPAGWLVDRYNRRYILAGGMAIWCAMTIACGFANSFASLFIARMGVGIGEAVLGPASYSMITGYFDRRRLPLALSVYSVGGSLGAGCAYVFGAMAEHIASIGQRQIPLLAGRTDWQAAFIFVGVPGVIVLAILLTLKDNRKTAVITRDSRSILPFLKPRLKFFVTYAIGIGLLTTVSYANMAWIPTMFLRVHGWPAARTAVWLGVMMLLAGSGGILSGGMLAMRISRVYADATLRVAALIAAALAPLSAIAALMPSPWLSLAAYVAFTFLSTSFVSLGPTSIQLITPEGLRGRVNGLALMLVNIIGISVGPVLIATITDHIFKDPAKIAWALGLGSAGLSLTAAIFIASCIPHYRRCLQNAE